MNETCVVERKLKGNQMGVEESRVQLVTDEVYKKQNQRKTNNRSQLVKRKSFYKIDQCQYPHLLMSQKYAHNQTSQNHQSHTEHRCTMKHTGYPDSYNLCSKCESQPQRIRKGQKVSYVKESNNIPKTQSVKYNYKPSDYKQRQILAPGPQVPGYYNGFSLPLDRYYKQKSQYGGDYSSSQVVKGSPYRQESKGFEESIVQEISQMKHMTRHTRQIDYEGYAQNLKF